MGDHTAFFYGTLMIPGVLYRVIYGSRTPDPWQQALTKTRPAILEGYQRRRVKSVHYPAIIPCEGACVRGSICQGLTEGDIWRLDIFEGDEYYKTKVKVKVLKDEVGLTEVIPDEKLEDYVVEELEADVYVWKDREAHKLDEGEWDFEEFRARKMKKWTGEEKLANGEEVDLGFADVVNAINKSDRAAAAVDKYHSFGLVAKEVDQKSQDE